MGREIVIPNKSYFKQTEVITLTAVKSYVLRFWESEFSQLNPQVSASGQKVYDKKDIELILKIKTLLFDQKMTIEQAKGVLSATEKLRENDVPQLPQGKMVRSLSDLELQRLIVAKAKIHGLLQTIRHIEDKHGWPNTARPISVQFQ